MQKLLVLLFLLFLPLFLSYFLCSLVESIRKAGRKEYNYEQLELNCLVTHSYRNADPRNSISGNTKLINNASAESRSSHVPNFL